jgi:hypothetical protein
MSVRPFDQFGRNKMQIAMANSGLGDRRLRELAHVGGVALKNCGLEAVVVIQMNVKRRQHEVVVVVLDLRQTTREVALMVIEYVGEAADNVRALVIGETIHLQPLSQEIADGLGAVRVSSICRKSS